MHYVMCFLPEAVFILCHICRNVNVVNLAARGKLESDNTKKPRGNEPWNNNHGAFYYNMAALLIAISCY